MIADAKSTPLTLDAVPDAGLPSSLGRVEAALRPVPQRWLQRYYGYFDIHTRQKWKLLRPILGGLPQDGLRVLDAGCGAGRWALDLAAHRPRWTIHGVDMDSAAIGHARHQTESLQLENLSFECADFFHFNPSKPFDVLLSIASAHYLAQQGKADALFRCFSEWVRPGGILLLYGPREPQDIPAVNWLPALSNDWGFSRLGLLAICQRAGFEVDAHGSFGLSPVIGRWSTVAKQISIATDGNIFTRIAGYPLASFLGSVQLKGLQGSQPSSAWLLVARRRIG